MALWKQAMSKLRGSTAKTSNTENDTPAVQVAPDQPSAETLQTDATTSSALAQELRAGIEVSIGDLEAHPAGWRYRGHPVMVFGTDAPELDDAKRRRDFFSLIHLHPCCGALKSDSRSAWVGTDLTAMNSAHDQAPFKPCKPCHEATAGRGSAPSQFDFVAHVRTHGDRYFESEPSHWRPGSDILSISAPARKATGKCPKCGCASAEQGWQVNKKDTPGLGLPEGICLLCAEREVEGCLHYSEQQFMEAAVARYRYLMDQSAKTPAPSWKLAEALLPLSWQPLLRSLQRMLPPPELFYAYSETAEPAILAWPKLRRGISAAAVDATSANGWSLWVREQIEKELGFQLGKK